MTQPATRRRRQARSRSRCAIGPLSTAASKSASRAGCSRAQHRRSPRSRSVEHAARSIDISAPKTSWWPRSFLEMAHVETRRLSKKDGTSAATPVEAVAAWIDGRLDLAFDDNIKSDLRQLSIEAQSQIFASPELIQPAYAEMLEPLIEQLQRGLDDGTFQDVDPVTMPSRSRAWCGRAPNGMGNRRLTSAATLVAPHSVLPARSRASRQDTIARNSLRHSLIRRKTRWTWVSPDRMPSSPAAARAWDWLSRNPLAAEGANVAVMARGKARARCRRG